MQKLSLKTLVAIFVVFLGFAKVNEVKACHGLAVVNFSYNVGATGVTVNGSSGSPTCGCGPYWLQVQLACTAAGVTGVPVTAIQNQLAAGTPYNSYPWYNSLLNVPNYTAAAGWPDQCVVEPYNSVFIPFAGLCPGQTYFFAAREWLGGSNSAGPWTAVNSFTVPGVLNPLITSITPSTTICQGQCYNLSVTTSGGCGTIAVNWSNGLGTGNGPKTVCPAVTTVYSATATAGPACQTNVSSTTVSVIPTPSAAFTASPSSQCLTGNLFTFTHTGTAGVTHNWNFGNGVTGTGNPVTQSYASAGTYVITHSVTIGSCTNTYTQSVVVHPQPNIPTFTPVNPTCGQSNGSVTVNATGGLAPYSYSLNGGANQASNSFTNLGPGTYTVTVTDSRGCTRQGTFTLTNQPGPTALALTPTNTGCGVNTGQISVGATTGGTPTYSFSLNNQAGPFSTGTSYTGLGAGTYTVFVKDANGCIFPQSVVIGTASGPTGFVTNTTPAGCTVNNGSITTGAVTGGTPTYSFSLNGGPFSTGTSYTNLASGSYTVAVLDVNNCTYNQTINVGQITGPNSLTLTPQPAACGGNTGSVNAIAAGGTPTYSFSIDGGALQTGTSFTNLASGTHTVMVVDVNGCTFSATTNVANAPGPTLSLATSTNVSCFGGANGSATMSPSGGTPGFTYTITPGGTTNLTGIFNGLSAQQYTVNVADNYGCPASTVFTITQPTALNGNLVSTTNVSCYNGTNGTANVSASGGTPTYSFSLNGGASSTNTNFTGLTASNFTVTVTDANGCTFPIPGTITQPPQLTLNVSNVNANCVAANGTATATVGGGTGTYSYTWTPSGGSAATTSGVVAGTYSVQVSDQNGCLIGGSTTIGSLPGGTASIPTIQNVLCNGQNNGSLTSSITGTSATSYTYAWTPSGGSAAIASGLSPGNYTVTITDNFGCVSSATATVTQPAALNFTLPQTNVSCFAGSNGTLLATGVTGGTPVYTYSWTPAVAGNVPNAAGLPIGTYSCTVTDANGCTMTISKTITQPQPLAITPTVVNSNCNQANGSITVAGSGGFPAYQFSLNGGAFQSSGTFNGLAAGTYTITIRDANLCTSPFPVTVVDQQGPTVSLNTQVNVSCFGQCNGSATTNISGGTPPYTYLWSNGQTTPNATNLCQGITSFTVTDAAGCEANLGVTITQPPVLTANAVGTNPLCNGSSNGSANVAVFGGTSPYTYAWSTAPSQTTATATGLGAGSYNVIVTDNKGCQQTATVTLTNPPAMVANIVKQDAKCFNACNGQATVTATNGTGPFSYAWTTTPVQSSQTAAGLCAGTYTVTVTDNNNCLATAAVTISQPTQLVASIPQSGPVSCSGLCDGWAQGNATGGTPPYVFSWTSGTLGSTANNLCAGQYTLTLTDSLACQTSSIVNITSPTALSLSATSTNATCFGSCNGTATASFSGGTAPYTFLWTPSLSQVSNPTTLCSGTHQVMMTDNNGCKDSVTVIVTEPSQITLVTNATQSSCGMANGSAGVTVSGGTPPFSYNWSNGPTSPINLNIPAGPYVVTVTDANNCQMQATANVNDLTGPTIIKIDSTNATCFGIDDGTAQVNIVGGNLPYQSISWLPSGATGMSATGLPAGQNTVKVIDALGCIASITFNIGVPTAVVSAISNVTHISCNGLCNGGATMLVVGGTPGAGYTYNWTPSGATTNAVSGILCAGIHTVTATDANGCITTATVTINQPPALLLTNNPGAVDITCFGAQNGSINVSVTGGTAPYTYGWSPANPSSPIITNLSAGSYTLNVTDNNGCTIPTTVYTINEPPALVLNPVVVNSTCSLPNGSATVNVSGGTPFPGNPAYQFQWNNTPPSNTASANNIAAGTYNCVVTDANGCTANVNAVVVDLPGPTFGNMASTNVTCNAGSDGSATVTSNGGTAPITYAWTNSGGSAVGAAANLTGVPAGIYNVMVTDANGCFFNQTVTVTEPLPFTLALSQGDSVCFGQTNPLAYIYATAGGGTAPYTYTWMLDGSGIPTLPGTPGTQTVTSVNPTTGFFSHTYSVSVVDANNCPAVGGTITTIVRPPLDASSLPVEGCDNDPATVSATPSGGNNGPYTINWQGGSSGLSSNITINYNSPDSVYYVYYTVNDGCSSPHNDSVQVTAHPLPILLFVADPVSGCSPLSTTFNPTSNISGTTFSWDYGDGSGSGSTPGHTYVEAGNGQITTYTITMTGTTAFGCVNTTTSTVNVWPGPIAGFYHQPNQTSELNPTIAFSNTTSGATSYVWSFGDPSSTNNSSTATHPSHNYDVAGSYEVVLIATNSQGCVDTAINTVIIDPDFVIYVPNAFTPNGDGINDYFFPKGVGISEDKYKLLIFNRWGEQIFQSDQFNKGWDGTSKGSTTIVQEDVYVWKIQCYDHKNEKHNLVGHVTVVK